MSLELKVPQAGESITEVEIGRWLRNQGDAVKKDEPLVEIETDKVTMEIPAPADGTLSQTLKQQGDSAEVGEVIGYVEQGQAGSTPAAAESKTSKAEKPAEPEKPAQASQQPSQPAKAEPQGKQNGESAARIMPAAQRLLDEHNLTADQVPASGPGGRLLKEDVQRYIDEQAPSQDAQGQAEAAKTPAHGDRQEEIVPMSPMRRRIAERLVEAQQNTAMLTTFNEVDMSAVMELRKTHRDSFEKQYGIRLGFMSFFVKASIDALKQFPAINAEIRDRNIIYKNYYDVGIAISSDKGLVVPILRNAERLSFAQIEQQITDYAKQISENRLKLEDLQGGTFTITNGGVFGSMLSTPILNPPQSGVLGMHSIQQRPMAIDGQVQIRPMMYLALTYDHRIVDGREAVSFLRRIKETVEEPSRMLMEI